MGRLLAIDYGLKRTGIAVTDPSKIIASPLETVPTHFLWKFLEDYFNKEVVDAVVIGVPVDLRGRDTDATKSVKNFITRFEAKYQDIPLHQIDERFTSKMAFDAMIAGGMSKKERRKKENIDKISASIILQSFMERQ
ncbi:MAG: Holliday junction resolvase RuvX [Candidatus Cyclobacteriaceae bacterium M2_1C_046]